MSAFWNYLFMDDTIELLLTVVLKIYQEKSVIAFLLLFEVFSFQLFGIFVNISNNIFALLKAGGTLAVIVVQPKKQTDIKLKYEKNNCSIQYDP